MVRSLFVIGVAGGLASVASADITRSDEVTISLEGLWDANVSNPRFDTVLGANGPIQGEVARSVSGNILFQQIGVTSEGNVVQAAWYEQQNQTPGGLETLIRFIVRTQNRGLFTDLVPANTQTDNGHQVLQYFVGIGENNPVDFGPFVDSVTVLEVRTDTVTTRNFGSGDVPVNSTSLNPIGQGHWNGTFTGSALLSQLSDANPGEDWHTYELIIEANGVPAPGSLVLLGTAALGLRRRR